MSELQNDLWKTTKKIIKATEVLFKNMLKILLCAFIQFALLLKRWLWSFLFVDSIIFTLQQSQSLG